LELVEVVAVWINDDDDDDRHGGTIDILIVEDPSMNRSVGDRCSTVILPSSCCMELVELCRLLVLTMTKDDILLIIMSKTNPRYLKLRTIESLFFFGIFRVDFVLEERDL